MEGMTRRSDTGKSGYHLNSALMSMDAPDDRRDPNAPPPAPVPDYRPLERFWPYVALSEQPSDEELAALSPDLSEALFGTAKLPFSVTVEFPDVDAATLDRAIALARGSREYRVYTTPAGERRHRARFLPEDAMRLRDLFDVVGQYDATEVLIDDRPVPYARELWLPLIWFLIR